jgi:hypothetical protein
VVNCLDVLIELNFVKTSTRGTLLMVGRRIWNERHTLRTFRT